MPSAVRHCASSSAAVAAFPTATRTGARPRPSQPDFLLCVPKPGRQTLRRYTISPRRARVNTTTTTTDKRDAIPVQQPGLQRRLFRVRIIYNTDAMIVAMPARRYARAVSLYVFATDTWFTWFGGRRPQRINVEAQINDVSPPPATPRRAQSAIRNDTRL